MTTIKNINDPNSIATDIFGGLVNYYNGALKLISPDAGVKNNIQDNKVSLLFGGGNGHEPIYHGLIGKNFADGSSCEDIFPRTFSNCKS